jgi:hypothetical protein
MSQNSQIVSYDPLRSLAFGSISGTYAKVGGALLNPVRIICLTNTTDGDATVSIDGTNAVLVVPAGSFKLFDLCTNRLRVSQYWVVPAGTQFFVASSASLSKGAFYIECLWGTDAAFSDNE